MGLECARPGMLVFQPMFFAGARVHATGGAAAPDATPLAPAPRNCGQSPPLACAARVNPAATPRTPAASSAAPLPEPERPAPCFNQPAIRASSRVVPVFRVVCGSTSAPPARSTDCG